MALACLQRRNALQKHVVLPLILGSPLAAATVACSSKNGLEVLRTRRGHTGALLVHWPPRLHVRGAADYAAVRYSIDLDEILGQCEVHKAILVVVAIEVRRPLRGDPAPAARDDQGGVLEEILGVAGGVDPLMVDVAADEQVDAVPRSEAIPIAASPLGREVRHNHLPIRFRLGQAVLQPQHLLLPEIREPSLALVDTSRALWTTSGSWPVVHKPADVVAGVHLWRPGFKDIGVDKVIFHTEVGVVHLLAVVL
mmetsp:Transcript_80342/g.208782  ORF Transcript_80342/g.208782 Transcript_80342/m.208782 type:complete len:253 (+) Transcript_80342:613-1371(+)